MPRALILGLAIFLTSPAEARPIAGPKVEALDAASASPGAPSLSAAPALAGSCVPNDVVISFGGTWWNGAAMRWEALQDSVWTFDTGIGSHFQHQGVCKDPTFHAAMEGWVGLDLSGDDEGRFRRLGTADFAGSGSTCVGGPGGLGGSYSLWCGLTENEADSACWASGQGYGTSWSVSVAKSFVLGGADSVRLEFDYRVDTEPGFDYAYVIADTSCVADGSGEVILATYNGTVAGSEILVLTAGVSLPSGPGGCLAIRFRFVSDGSYDDADGLYPTACGAFAVDDIRVTSAPYGGTLDDFSDLETGPQGWEEERPVCGPGGDFTRLMSLDDLDPLPPQVCGVSDSVLVFFDPALQGHGPDLDNLAISPWIDLAAAGVAGWGRKHIAFDARANLPFSQNGTMIRVMTQYYPDTCAVTGAVGLSELEWNGLLYETPRDTCLSYLIDVSYLIPPGAELVRIALGAVNHCEPFVSAGCGNAQTNTTPYLDNVRLLVSEFATLQAAIDAAAPGDTVFVPPGTYLGAGNQFLDFGGKNLVLYAACGPDRTTLNIASNARGFDFHGGEDSTSVVSGFTIRGGGATLGKGGAAWIRNGSHPVFENCLFRFCDADTGSAIAVEGDSSVRLDACRFLTNGLSGTAGRIGGAVYIGTDQTSVAPSRITHCDFRDNNSGNGGAIWAVWADIEDCTFTSNSGDNGGAVVALGGPRPCTVRDCTFAGNAAAQEGGGLLSYGGRALDSSFFENTAQNGGAASLQTAVLLDVVYGSVFSGCTVTGNVASGAGGGVLVGPRALVENCIVQANIAATGGGVAGGGCGTAPPAAPRTPLAPDPCPAPPTLLNTLISGNAATSHGGGVALWGAGANGIMLEGCTVTGNLAEQGGAFHLPAQVASAPYIALERTISRDNGGTVSDPLVHFADAGGVLDLVCSAVDSTEFTGPGAIQMHGPQVLDDPAFCFPEPYTSAPTTEGLYSLITGSPCLPANNACGVLVGARGEDCAATGLPVTPTPRVPGLRAVPSPFTGGVTILLAPPAGIGRVTGTLRVFDVAGRIVQELVLSDPGERVLWDGRNAEGEPVAPGLYFIRVTAGNWSATGRIVKSR